MNIAEILKNVPKGTKLYSPVLGDVTFKGINSIYIEVLDLSNIVREFYHDGRFYMSGDCILFPSKECRDWNEFRLDLPEGTTVMVSDDKKDWKLRFYSGYKRAYQHGKRCGEQVPWMYIIPVDKFDFKDLTVNIEDNYGTANY